MTGGLLSILSYGSDDLYLTGAPQITFFKIVYRRHTNFSIESIEVGLNTNVTGCTLTSFCQLVNITRIA